MVFNIKESPNWQDNSSFWNGCKGNFNSCNNDGESILSDIKESFVRSIRRRASLLSIDQDMPEFLRQASQTLVPGARTQRRRSVAMPSSCSDTTKFQSVNFLKQGRLRLRRNTTSSTHTEDPIELRHRLWSASKQRSSPALLSERKASCSVSEQTCPYSMCSVSRTSQNFLENSGKVFVFAEYLKEEKKLEVVLSQYSNVEIQGHFQKKKPDVSVQIKIKFADGHTRAAVKKLKFCRSTKDFKMNYHSCFDCESEDVARAAGLEVTVLYKKSVLQATQGNEQTINEPQ